MNRFTIGIDRRGDFGVVDRVLKKVVRIDNLTNACELSRDLNNGSDKITRYGLEPLDESWNAGKDEP